MRIINREKGKSKVKNKVGSLAQNVIELVRLDCIPYCSRGSIIQSLLTCRGWKYSSILHVPNLSPFFFPSLSVKVSLFFLEEAIPASAF